MGRGISKYQQRTGAEVVAIEIPTTSNLIHSVPNTNSSTSIENTPISKKLNKFKQKQQKYKKSKNSKKPSNHCNSNSSCNIIIDNQHCTTSTLNHLNIVEPKLCDSLQYQQQTSTLKPIGIATTVVHQQQFESLTSTGSVVITIRMLKMESNDINNLVVHQSQSQSVNHLNNRIGSESNVINNEKCVSENKQKNNPLIKHLEAETVQPCCELKNINNNNDSINSVNTTNNNKTIILASTSVSTLPIITDANYQNKNNNCIGLSMNSSNIHNLPCNTNNNKIFNHNFITNINSDNDNKNDNNLRIVEEENTLNLLSKNTNCDISINKENTFVSSSALPGVTNTTPSILVAQSNDKKMDGPKKTNELIALNLNSSNLSDTIDKITNNNINQIAAETGAIQQESNLIGSNTDAIICKLNQANITSVVNSNNNSQLNECKTTTVSPYPHHIPNFNHEYGDECAAHCVQCHRKKNDQLSSSSSSPNSNTCCNKCFIKDTTNKEGKTKKANWGIKFNCTKLKSIKSTSSSSSGPGTAPVLSTVSNTITIPSTSTTQWSSLPATLPQISLPAPNLNGFHSTSPLLSTTTSTAPIFSAAVSTTMPPSTSSSTTLVLENAALYGGNGGNVILVTMDQRQPLLDFSKFNSEDYPIEDCDKKARLQRAFEIAEGVEPPPGFLSSSMQTSPNSQILPISTLSSPSVACSAKTATEATNTSSQHQWQMLCSNNAALFMLPNLIHPDDIPRIHSQVDYIHCLVPDLKKITSCTFYWGKMDRYEAERLLEGKPEGTFLLRDSAQEEFLFSVSFRKYGRSLHARIEQFNHKFSFDCHDPGVYTSSTVTGLLEHYKDPACVMFFEPALTLPLNRNFVFSLQQLCRATIVSNTTYDGINDICLPNKLKSYLKEYHYKQRVRVKRFDETYYNTS